MEITVNVETCGKEYSSYYIDTPVKTPTPRVVSFSLVSSYNINAPVKNTYTSCLYICA
jgi:hypothetical protein